MTKISFVFKINKSCDDDRFLKGKFSVSFFIIFIIVMDDSKLLLHKVHSDIDSLPVKVDEVVDLVRENFESKCKIHYDYTQTELFTLHEKLKKERADLQDTSEINRLVTNVNNLRKDLESRTSAFHR